MKGLPLIPTQPHHFAGHWNLYGWPPGQRHRVTSVFRSIYTRRNPVAAGPLTAHTCAEAHSGPLRPHPNRKPRRPWGWREGSGRLHAPRPRPLRWCHHPPLDLTVPPPSLPTRNQRRRRLLEAMEASELVAAPRGEEASCSSWGAGRWENECGREAARGGGREPGADFLLPLGRVGSAREAAEPGRTSPGWRGERAGWVWRRGLGPLRLPASLRRKATSRSFPPFLSSSWGLPSFQSPDVFGEERARCVAEWSGLCREFWPGSLGVSFPALLPNTFPSSFGKMKAKSATVRDLASRSSFENYYQRELGNDESEAVRTPWGLCWLQFKKKKKIREKTHEFYSFLLPVGVKVFPVFYSPVNPGGGGNVRVVPFQSSRN